MLNKILTSAFVLFFAFSSSLLASNTLNLNAEKSSIKWEGKKVVGRHFGKINPKNGIITIEDNKITAGNVNVDMTSIVVEDLEDKATNAKLTGHLKSDDFFSTEKNTTSTFKLKSVKENAGKYTVTGDLTIKGNTNSVSFTPEVMIKDNMVTLKGKLVVDRTKFDIKYGSGSFFDNLGDKAIDNDFTLDLNLQFAK